MCKCDFCSAIYDLNKLINIPGHKRTVVNAIVYDAEERTFGLFHECEDEYYTDNIMDIEFCPMCGKRLSNDNLEEYCVNCKHSIVDGAATLIKFRSSEDGKSDFQAKIKCKECGLTMPLSIADIKKIENMYNYKGGYYEDEPILYGGLHAFLIDKWNNRTGAF